MPRDPQIVDGRDGAGLDAAARILRSGGVVAVAFERLFGLAGNALDPRVVERVAAIKRRPVDGAGFQPIAVIAPEMEAVERLTAHFTPLARTLAGRHWPGPLTLLLEAAPGLPGPLVSPQGLIGVRMAGECPAAELARRSGLVLTATSANLSGRPDIISIEELSELSGLDMIVASDVTGPPGSTVVDASGPEPIVLRRGVVEIPARRRP